MAGASNYLEQKILEHVVGKTSFTMPTNVYVGLYTTAPSDDNGTGAVEVSGGSYARVQTTDASWTVMTDGVGSNANAITFPQATANWGNVKAFGIFDASTAGNLLIWNTVTTAKDVNNGDTAKFLAGDLDLTHD